MDSNFLNEKIQVEKILGGITKYSFQPGNGYKYDILIVSVASSLCAGMLGGIEKGWLVVNAWNGISYLFSTGGNFLTTDYVKEKLFDDRHAHDTHVNAVTAVLSFALGRDTDADINEMGIFRE